MNLIAQKVSQINILITLRVGLFLDFFCYDFFPEYSAVLHLCRKEKQGELTRKFLKYQAEHFTYCSIELYCHNI